MGKKGKIYVYVVMEWPQTCVLNWTLYKKNASAIFQCKKRTFLNFPAYFYFSIFFSNLNLNCSNLQDMGNFLEQVKKTFCYQKCLDLSLFEWIVLVISKKLQILGLQPRISKVFSQSLEQFFSQYFRTILVRKYHFHS